MNAALSSTRGSRWRQKALQLTTAALTGAVILAASGCGNPGDGETAEVIRVIDGDTLVVSIHSEEQTVRLLNVDTPETKDPDKPVECMGQEATSYLEQLTPPGTKVGLDYDVEREDRYGRTLAAVFLPDETLVNAEIVRNGFGVPVVFEPNRKYYEHVLAAQGEARQAQAGLYNSTAECTVPAEVAQALQALEAAVVEPAGATAATAGAALAGLTTALLAAKALNKAVGAAKGTAWVAAVSATTMTELVADLKHKIKTAEQRHSTVAAVATRLQKAEAASAKAKTEQAKQAAAAKAAAAKQAAAVQAEQERVAAAAKVRKAQEKQQAQQKQQTAAARAEQERQAAAVQAEQDRVAATERERIRNLLPVPAPEPYVPPPPEPYVPPAPEPYVPPAPVQQDPYPGYTGPRCYAPGGKTWKPCP